MNVLDPELGRRIKQLRESLEEGQTAFGARFGVEQPTVSRWEVGKIPKRTLWAKIAVAAGMSPAEFFYGVTDPDEPSSLPSDIEYQSDQEKATHDRSTNMYLDWLNNGLRKPGKTKVGLAAVFGVHPSQITRMFKDGGRRIKADELQKIAAYIEEPLPRVGPIIHSFDPDAPETPLDPDAEPNANAFPQDAIKELAAKGGMGSGQTITTTYVRDGQEIVQRDGILDDYWRLPPDFVRSAIGARVADLLIIACTGDSMDPTLRAGDRVVANTAHKKPSPDGLYAIRDQLGEVIVKRLELFGVNPPRIRIISDNPAHGRPQELGLDEVEIVGRVVAGLKLF